MKRGGAAVSRDPVAIVLATPGSVVARPVADFFEID
jgi:hypothetical protein